jgi:hypothetical protein
MSRIRTIKPDFWVNEQIMSCSPNARLLFIGLWNFADDNGIHRASIKCLKAEVYPSDSFSEDEMKKWITELISNELLQIYTVEDKAYWIVTGWKNHQRIDRPTYKHPQPLSAHPLKNNDEKIAQNSASPPRTFDEHSAASPRVFDDYSISPPIIFDKPSATEWKGVAGKEEEKDICEVNTSPLAVVEKKPIANTSLHGSKNKDVQDIFSHWQTVMQHPNAKLDKRRLRKIEIALKDYSVDDLKKAIDGCANTPFNMGSNERSQKYDGIDLIFRDAEHIERFITNATDSAHTWALSSNPIFAGVI